MNSLASWIVDVIRRATPNTVRSLSALMIGVVFHTLWRKRVNASNVENSELEMAPCAETSDHQAPSSNTTLDRGNETQNEETVQSDPEKTNRQDSSAVVLSEKVCETLEVSNGFETSSRKSLGTDEVSINIHDALPGKREVSTPTSNPNGIDTDDIYKLEKVFCTEATVKEDLKHSPIQEIPNGIVKNSTKTVDPSNGEANNTYTRLIATLSMLNEYDTNLELVKKGSRSFIERSIPDDTLNVPTGCDGNSGLLESASVGFREVPAKEQYAAVWEKFFNATEELIKKTEASIQKFRVKVLEIVDDNDFDSDGFPDAEESTVEFLSSESNDACVEAQGLGNGNPKSEGLPPDVTKSKDSSDEVSEEEVFKTIEVLNDFLKTSLRRSSETGVLMPRTYQDFDEGLPEKREVIVNGDNSNSLELSENPRSEGCQKDQVLNIIDSLQDLKLDDNKDHKVNPSELNLENTDIFGDFVDACDMLLSLTQSLNLSHVVLNGFTLYDYYATCSYYIKLLTSSLVHGNSTREVNPNNHSNLGSENNLDKVFQIDTSGKLGDICKTNTNFKNFVLREFLKEGLIHSYHIPENDTRTDMTVGYREPEYQYLSDGACNSGDKQSLLESSFEESNETTEDCECYTVSSYTLPEDFKACTSISSLDGELEVRIEHEDFEVKTYRLISADMLRYEMGNPLDFEGGKDPFRPAFPSRFEGWGRCDSLKFEDSFTANPVRDGSETSLQSCVVLLDLGPEKRSVNTREPKVKGDGFKLTEDRDNDDDDDDDDDDEKKDDERDDGSSKWRKGEDGGSEKNGESSENPGDGQNGGGTGSSGGDGGDDKKKDDSKGKKIKDEDEEQSDSDDGDEKAEVSSEKDENIADENNEKGSTDTKKNISTDAEASEIVLAMTALSVDDHIKKLRREALYSYKIRKHKSGASRKDTFESRKKKRVEGEEKDKGGGGDDEQPGESNPSGGNEERGDDDGKGQEGGSSGETGGQGSGGGSGSSGGGDDKKKGDDDFVREKTVEEDEKPSEEEDENKSEDALPSSSKASSESDPKEGTPGGSKVPSEDPRGTVGNVRSQASGTSDSPKRRRLLLKEEDKNESEDPLPSSSKASSEIDPQEGTSSGPTVPSESPRGIVSQVRSQATRTPNSPKRRRYFGKKVLLQKKCTKKCKRCQGEYNFGWCTSCKRLNGKTPAVEQFTGSDESEGSVSGSSEGMLEISSEDRSSLPQSQPGPSGSSDPTYGRREILHDIDSPVLLKSMLERPIPEVEAKGNRRVLKMMGLLKDSKKGKTQEKGGDSSRNIESPHGPTEAKRHKNTKDATVSPPKGSKSPKASKQKKVAIESSACGREESTEVNRPIIVEDVVRQAVDRAFLTSNTVQEMPSTGVQSITIQMEPRKRKQKKQKVEEGCRYSQSPKPADNSGEERQTADFTLSDEDIGSCADSEYSAPYSTFAPPPVELPQDSPENVDETEEENPGPLDLSKKSKK